MICSKGRAGRAGVLSLVLLLALLSAGGGGATPAGADKQAPDSATALRADQLAATLLAEFKEYDACLSPDDPRALRYVAAPVDLNDDGKAEVVTLMFGEQACGTGGCTAFVLRDTGTGYSVVTRMTSVSAPILASSRRSGGWRDLIVGVHGGGAEAGPRVLRYSGNRYPDNASLADKATSDADALLQIAPDQESSATLLVPEACRKTGSVTATEALGGLRIGDSANAVEPKLGPGEALSTPTEWQADGLFHRTWTFPAAGAVVGLSGPGPKTTGAKTTDPKPTGPWTVSSVTLNRPGKTTARGIGIGASRAQVVAAYGDTAKQGEGRSLRVGSDYDALMFTFDEHDRVVQIFLGSTAE